MFAGYVLNGDHVDAGPKLQQYVDEALEEIEYCTGPADSDWGRRRAADGHPTPFKIRYVEIGNEDFFDKSKSYDGRFAQFFDAIKAKHPELQLIATMPVKSRKPDMVDDHFYRSAKQLEFDDHHYDKIDRKGPKIFVGEWACTEGRPTPTLNAALADAAWLMGLERNSDLVLMSCYAPLLVNVNPKASQWSTNLIGYDSLSSFGSPSYWAQRMINENRGDVVLPTELKFDEPERTSPAPHGAAGVGSWHTAVEYKEFSITDTAGHPLISTEKAADSRAWKRSGRGAEWTIDGKGVRQSNAEATNCLLTIGDSSWGDYNVHVKARKSSGAEGFLLVFHASSPQDYLWWNVGGWDNSRTTLENTIDGGREPFGPSYNYPVETGRWYDLRVEIRGRHIRCFIDDKLTNEADEESPIATTPLFAESCSATASGEVFVKIVNASSDTVDATVHLAGAKTIDPNGTATVLTSSSPDDQNTTEAPRKVAPVEEPLKDLKSDFVRSCPPHSFTILRLKASR